MVMHGEDDHIVPFELTGAKVVKFLRNGKLISYPVFRTTTEAPTINADILAFYQVIILLLYR